MAPMTALPQMAADMSVDDIARLRSLLDRKLQNVPVNHLPSLTVEDVLEQTSKALHIPTLPQDLQLGFFLRNRNIINRNNECPSKDENQQSLKITRAIFFYHLSETYQFQRFHDTARWNLALFTALLTRPAAPTTTGCHQSLCRPQPSVSDTESITPAARRFMVSYLAAVMERHNTLTVFDKREEFVRRWKDSNFDLFVSFKAAQAKLIKKAMQKLNVEWEAELDRAMRAMGKTQYNARVARFVGNITPGRKDQGLAAGAQSGVRDFTRSASPSPEAREDMDTTMDGENELLEALRVPLEERTYQNTNGSKEEGSRTPVDIRYAITAMQNARPADMLQALMRLFPAQMVRENRWGEQL